MFQIKGKVEAYIMLTDIVRTVTGLGVTITQ